MFKTPRAGPRGPATLLTAVAGPLTAWAEAVWPDPTPLLAIGDGRRQLWFAFGAQLARRPEQVSAPREPAALARWLDTASAAEILRTAGLGAPRGWRRALAGLGPFALADPAGYAALFGVLADEGPGADILRHAEPVTEPLIGVLAALDPPLRRPALVAALLRDDADAANSARRWSWRLARLRARWPDVAAAVERAVADGAAPTDLLDEDGPGWDAPFPPPPWEGTPRLRPLRDAAAMNAAGERFRNCLHRRSDSVREGHRFYYEWLGDPGMIVELEPDRPYGWAFEDALLAMNKRPPAEALAALHAELAAAPDIFVPPLRHVRYGPHRLHRLHELFDNDDDEEDEAPPAMIGAQMLAAFSVPVDIPVINDPDGRYG